MEFELGPGVACDLDSLVDSRLLVQANSGGGKSWCIRRLLEQTFGSVQHLVIDPEGEFASLRERFDYVLAAKQGGDTAADPRSAKLLARRLLELNASAILDIYELKAHERVLFVRYFLEALVDAPKNLWHPALVIIDEAHVYCPQKGEAQSAPAVIDLATRGRKRGFCAVLATQRLSKLHKDAAAECNNKLIGRSLEIDAKRAADELGFAGREAWQDMRLLAPGEFFAYGPSLTIDVTKVRIGDVQTTHPEAGARIAFTAPPPTDKVLAMLPKLSDLPAEAEAERQSMADLKRDLSNARRELTLAQKSAAPPDEAVIERRVTAAVSSEHKALEKVMKQQGNVQGRELKRLERVIETASRELGGVAERLAKATNGGSHDQTTGRTGQARNGGALSTHGAAASRGREGVSEPSHDSPPARGDRQAAGFGNGTGEPLGEVTRPQQRILDQLAVLESMGIEAPHKTVVAVFAGVSPKSGGYFNNLGALRSAGLIVYPQASAVALTGAGRQETEQPEAPLSLADLHEAWTHRVSSSQAALLREVIAIYPQDIEKGDLAERAGVSATSGGYFNNLGRLRTMGAIAYPQSGRVVATNLLFPEGLA